MRKDYHRAALIFIHAAVVAPILSITSTSAQVYDKSTPPPLPPWVDADGKVNLDRVPRDLPVLGRDGNVVTDAGGQPKRVPTYMGAPPVPVRTGPTRGQ
jgi:hypothetical protein